MNTQQIIKEINTYITISQNWILHHYNLAMYLAIAILSVLLLLLLSIRKKNKIKALKRSASGLDLALNKTRSGIVNGLKELVGLGRTIDDDFLEELQSTLLSADVGALITTKLIAKLEDDWVGKKIDDNEQIINYLKQELHHTMGKNPPDIDFNQKKPHVILVVGVNGSGKTTTIGKLANSLVKDGKKVLLGASDTFRAAAAEQLEVWANRVGCQIVRQNEGAAPATVAYDAAEAALARDIDVLIIDTAGRLHNKKNLMLELEKVFNIINKKIPGAPHEVLMVIDACTGQNALNQVKTFKKDVKVTGIVATKLDGTAKGGVLLAIQRDLGVPIRYIGTGEGIEDFDKFDKNTFIDALFS